MERVASTIWGGPAPESRANKNKLLKFGGRDAALLELCVRGFAQLRRASSSLSRKSVGEVHAFPGGCGSLSLLPISVSVLRVHLHFKQSCSCIARPGSILVAGMWQGTP